MFNKSRIDIGCRSLMVFAALFIISSAGCATTGGKPALLIGNATGEVIDQVRLITGAGEKYSFDAVPPFSVSGSADRTSPLSREMRVEWHCVSGVSKSAAIIIPDDILDFAGLIQFQIDREDSVKVFTAPLDDARHSVLPWSMPASWEGSPSLPGMNM